MGLDHQEPMADLLQGIKVLQELCTYRTTNLHKQGTPEFVYKASMKQYSVARY